MKPHTPAHAQSKVRVTQSALRPRPHTRTHRHARLTSVAVSDRKDPVCPSHSESTASFALWKTVAPFELFSHDVQHFSTQHQSGETLLFDGKKSYVFIASVHADILQTLQATRGTILSADLKYPFALFVLGESLRFLHFMNFIRTCSASLPWCVWELLKWSKQKKTTTFQSTLYKSSGFTH